MTAAYLTVIATACFWQVGHNKHFHFDSLAACWQRRPQIVADMVADGCTGVVTPCREVKGDAT